MWKERMAVWARYVRSERKEWVVRCDDVTRNDTDEISKESRGVFV